MGWDAMKSDIFAKTEIRLVQRLLETRLLNSVAVPFWKGRASLSAEHDLCAEQAVLIGNCTYSTRFFCDMADGLKPDTVSFSLGGQKYPVFFPDNSIIRVLNLNQYQTVSMQIGGQLDSASGRCSTQAGFCLLYTSRVLLCRFSVFSLSKEARKVHQARLKN